MSDPTPSASPDPGHGPAAGYELVRLRGGTWGIRSRAFDEICHPGVGPRAEAEALYVQGLELPRRFEAHARTQEAAGPGSASGSGSPPFVVWDVGLGGAANATAVLEAARPFDLTLEVLSFDQTLDQLAFALAHAAELDCFGSVVDAVREFLTTRDHTGSSGRAAVRWRAVLGDFPSLLASASAAEWPAPHAILFDPHSPAANPDMWTLPVFRNLHARLDPARPCALATYSRSTAIRAALLLAGFYVGTGGTTEAKEDTTLAANQPELLARPLGTRWLERARRSRAAEPWTSPPFEGRPLAEQTWEALRVHPQFRSLPTEASSANEPRAPRADQGSSSVP